MPKRGWRRRPASLQGQKNTIEYGSKNDSEKAPESEKDHSHKPDAGASPRPCSGFRINRFAPWIGPLHWPASLACLPPSRASMQALPGRVPDIEIIELIIPCGWI